MNTSTHPPLQSAGVIAALEELSRMGSAIYDDRLRAILEPDCNGKFVAIHVDSGDYTVGRSSGETMRAMHKLHADSRLLVMKIGPEPEYGLAARILAAEMMEGRQK
jgi:hypothetical protein